MRISGGEVFKAEGKQRQKLWAELTLGFLENKKEARETGILWAGEGKGSMNITVVGSLQGGLKDPQLLQVPLLCAPFEGGYTC